MKGKIIVQGILSAFIITMVLGMGSTGYGASKGEEQAMNTGQEANAVANIPPELDIMFVLDNSGSMMKNDPEFITRKVVTNFLNSLDEGSRLGMVIFDQKAKLVEPLTGMDDPEAASGFLGSLETINYKGKFTNTPAGVERAIYELKAHAREEARKVLILLTDGIVDTGDRAQDLDKSKWLREDLSRESAAAGIRIFGIAFTDDADFSLIQTLASRTNGAYFRAYNAEDIPTVFEKINDAITEMPPELEPTAPPAPRPATPEPQKTILAPAPPDVQPPLKEKRDPLPLILSGIVIALIAIVLVTALKKKRDESSSPFGLKGRPEEDLPPDHPVFKAELIDVENVISDETLSLVLSKLVVSIGRDPSNDIVIPQESISSLHATIEYKNGYFYLEDHRSTNGTKVNNKELEENKPARLKSGDKIHFAVFEFRFLLRDQAPFGETVLLDVDDV